ncbi:hypothetical protein [Agromyces sp. SYSU T00194]|uniref:hypothetical protein n=1 Tax=Agromyces chitinivorans TaxID=3158560 RepID=UPI003394DCE6
MSPSTPHRSQSDGHVEPTPLSRRGIVTGAAWALPTIALAATVPVAAASEPAPVCVLFVGTSKLDQGVDSIDVSLNYGTNASAAIAAEMTIRVTAVEGLDFTGINGVTTFPQDFPVRADTLDAQGRLQFTITRPGGEEDGADVFVTIQQLSSGGQLCASARYSFEYLPFSN